MGNLIETIVLTSLFCNGLWWITQEGKLLYFTIKWLDDYEAKKKQYYKGFEPVSDRLYNEHMAKIWRFTNPLITCIVCMASVWGTLIFLAYNDFNIINWIICIVNSSALNGLIWKLIHEKK